MTSVSPFETGTHFQPNVQSQPDVDTKRDFDPAANAWYVPIDRTAISSDEVAPASEPSRMEQLHKISLMLHQPEDPVEVSSVGQAWPATTENNLRQFARCAISEGQSTCLLTLKGRRYKCRLVEMSIGGFGVEVDGHPKFALGTTGNLRAPGLNYSVSVTRQEERPGGLYVGLKQVCEILDHKRQPGEAPPIVSYCIAAFSGAMIAMIAYFMMYGTKV